MGLVLKRVYMAMAAWYAASPLGVQLQAGLCVSGTCSTVAEDSVSQNGLKSLRQPVAFWAQFEDVGS